MSGGRFWLGALAYVAVTFPVAVVWHVVLLGGTYERIGYFGREPVFALGFLAIALQGIVLSALYPRFARGRGPLGDGLAFGLVAGFFLWTSQVVAHAAKSAVDPVEVFLAVETAYFALQFALAGIAIGFAHQRRPGPVRSGSVSASAA